MTLRSGGGPWRRRSTGFPKRRSRSCAASRATTAKPGSTPIATTTRPITSIRRSPSSRRSGRGSRSSPGLAYEPKINGSLFRINRDVRFSKDKRPYKTHLDLWFWHGERRGWDSPGFFFRMFADRLILGAGMHRFETAQLAAYRKAVVDARAGKALAQALDRVRQAGPYAIGAAARKTIPRGFDADHPRASLLLHEGLTAEYDGPVDKAVGTAGFVDVCLDHCRAMAPVAKWLLAELVATG